MLLDPSKFNAHLVHIGQRFSWRKSWACPCVGRNSGQPDRTCPNCGGKGRLWGGPVQGVAGIVARSAMRKYSSFGVWDDGDLLLSIPSDSPIYGIGSFDRVAAMDKREAFSINVVAGVNDVFRFAITSVARVFWLDENKDIVDGTLPTVDADGTLTWSGTTPPQGVTYSLTGQRIPEYFVWLDIPIDRPEHSGAQLPRRVAVRRIDLFGVSVGG